MKISKMAVAYYNDKMQQIWRKLNGWQAEIAQRESKMNQYQALIDELNGNNCGKTVGREKSWCEARIKQLQHQIDQLHKNIEKHHEIKYYYGLLKEKCCRCESCNSEEENV